MSYGYQGPPVMPYQGQRPPTSFGAPPGAPSAPGAPPYPQSSNVGFNHPPTSFGMPQPYASHGSSPYPSQTSPYAPQQQPSPYGQHQPSHAQPQPAYSPYQSSPYPAQPSPYPPNNDSSPYPTQQNSPYPPQSTHQSPYPPAQNSPYPPQSTQQSPYPPQSIQQSLYSASQKSPYPQQSPYNPAQKLPFSSPSSHFDADKTQQNVPYNQQHHPSKYQQQTLHGPYTAGHNQHAHSGAGGRPQSAPYPSSGNPSPYPANASFHGNSASNPGGMYPGGQGTGETFRSSSAGLTSSAPPYQYSPAPRKTQYKAKLSPTVVPYGDFDPRSDAEVLRKAMKGFGTDEKSIINVLANRSNLQRQEIASQFKTLYGKDLIKDLKSELSGNFEDLVVAMMTPLPQYYAKELNNAMSGIGTDECVLIEVLCTMSNHEIRVIKQAYECMYGRTLEDDLRGDTSGSFKRLMVSLCCANRDESFDVDPSAAMEDARQLLQAGELRFGTDESTFNAILVQRNVAQLHQIFQEYQGITGHTIEEAIENEFSGDIKKGLLAIVKCVNNRAGFFAEQLYKSMKGMGTDDRRLIRLVVTRCEVDMGEIKQAFVQEYGQSLEDFISDDCSGHYKKCLLSLIA